MECKYFQNQFEDFDYSRLPLKKSEAFINHIKNCPDCREEFELYYIVKYGLSDDDIIENQNTNKEDCQQRKEFQKLFDSLDFAGIVDLKIKIEEQKIARILKFQKYNRYSLMTIDVLMLLTVIIWLIINYL